MTRKKMNSRDFGLFVVKNYKTMSNEAIGEVTGRSRSRVLRFMKESGLRRTREEKALIREKETRTSLTRDQKIRIRETIIRNLNLCTTGSDSLCDCEHCLNSQTISEIDLMGKQAAAYFKKIEHLLLEE